MPVEINYLCIPLHQEDEQLKDKQHIDGHKLHESLN